MMKIVTLDTLVERHDSLLKRVGVDKCLSEMAGMPMPHETGAMGNIMPKKKKKLYLMPKDIEDEKAARVGGVDVEKTFGMIRAIQKLDSQGEEGINAGFGHQDNPSKKEDKKISDKDESLYVPEDIDNEEGLVHKASYEQVSEGGSWTDETSPIDDSFYLPSKIRDESSDTDKGEKAKKDKKEAEEAQQEYFGKVPDNASDQGRARIKQNYNVGTMENAQIGGQGFGEGGGGIGKSDELIKVVNIKLMLKAER